MTARYDQIGMSYATTRCTDDRIAEQIGAALGDAGSVVNVGAGTGSYEPLNRAVIAVEPSAVMLAQRGPASAPAIQAAAEALPFADGSFDAAMALLTVHHWTDPRRGLVEMRRVTRRRVVILTWDQDVFETFWPVSAYWPAIAHLDRGRTLAVADIGNLLGNAAVRPLIIPSDCRDGFLGAFWRRPQAYLEPGIRAGISGFKQIDPVAEAAGVQRLADDLASGAWDQRFGHLLEVDELDIGYRLIVAEI